MAVEGPEPDADEKAGELGATEKVDEITNCPECNSPHLSHDYQKAEIVCQACGLVLEESIIDQGPEWRAFDAEQSASRARTGAPTSYTLPDKGLTTTIDRSNRDAMGGSITGEAARQAQTIRKWQRRIRLSRSVERNLNYALTELGRMANQLKLPRDVQQEAGLIYRKAVEKGLVRGRSIEALTAASLYAACRTTGLPRTLDEVASASPLHRRDIGRSYRFLAREMQLKVAPPGPLDYISRFCSELELSTETQQEAQRLLKSAGQEELISGRGPTGFAGAAIYLATRTTGERRSQKVIAQVTGVTEVTIRNRYRELATILNIEID